MGYWTTGISGNAAGRALLVEVTSMPKRKQLKPHLRDAMAPLLERGASATGDERDRAVAAAVLASTTRGGTYGVDELDDVCGCGWPRSWTAGDGTLRRARAVIAAVIEAGERPDDAELRDLLADIDAEFVRLPEPGDFTTSTTRDGSLLAHLAERWPTSDELTAIVDASMHLALTPPRGAENLDPLLPLAAHLRWLSLGETAIDLRALGSFTELRELRMLGARPRHNVDLSGLAALHTLHSRAPHAVSGLVLPSLRCLFVAAVDDEMLSRVTGHLRVFRADLSRRLTRIPSSPAFASMEELTLNSVGPFDLSSLAGHKTLRVIQLLHSPSVVGVEALATIRTLEEVVIVADAIGGWEALLDSDIAMLHLGSPSLPNRPAQLIPSSRRDAWSLRRSVRS
ncbi:hypothetical protein FE697_015880 [Mumia zhuanghuii]|uniref:Leucine-rich repeat domain-containing protein n=2 Tax=Mumia TaxID=1546255 RepID=A0ABW1QRB2_9ACTN|nr:MULTISPECIES: hypothetical protein [Mumia]KAA1420444.1 hypothetical protein FE697_015880 [Mumia zhuanghuii]